MEIIKIKSESTQVPDDTSIRHLSGSLYEFIGNFNIIEKQIERDNEMVTVYTSDLVHITTNVKTRDDMIVALIRLKYTQDDEFALVNKGIANAQDEEYLIYRDYVNLCKEQSSLYYDKRTNTRQRLYGE